jgi:hypothetical protein
MIIHACHHKTGTVWFDRILWEFCSKTKKTYHFAEAAPCSGFDISVAHHSRIPESIAGKAVRMTHMIRDPREMVISGYLHHKRSDEAWLQQPSQELGGKSYQQALNSVDQEEGLMLEIERMSRTSVKDMLNWNYTQEQCLELKFEHVRDNPEAWFSKIGEHYRLPESEALLFVSIALKHCVKHNPEVVNHRHVTSNGRDPRWPKYLTGPVGDYYATMLGDCATQLGYDDNKT